MTGCRGPRTFAPVPTTPTGPQTSVRRRRLARRGRVWPIVLTWTAYAIALGFVGAGWWIGKPLTPELLAVLVSFLGFNARTDLATWRRLRGHDSALAAIAEHRGISQDRVASAYDLVDEDLARQEARERKQPPKPRRSQR